VNSLIRFLFFFFEFFFSHITFIKTRKFLVLSDPLGKNTETSLQIKVVASDTPGSGFEELQREWSYKV
jgi:hypothetical protein